jgi:hypothetical protein
MKSHNSEERFHLLTSNSNRNTKIVKRTNYMFNKVTYRVLVPISQLKGQKYVEKTTKLAKKKKGE